MGTRYTIDLDRIGVIVVIHTGSSGAASSGETNPTHLSLISLIFPSLTHSIQDSSLAISEEQRTTYNVP